MRKVIEKAALDAAKELGLEVDHVDLEYPDNPEHGDYSSNIALALAKSQKTNPRDLASKICEQISKGLPDELESANVAGPGFINFKIKDAHIVKEVVGISASPLKNSEPANSGKKVMVEYTDPNPFKIFHIGHLMANAIGESIARLEEYSGAKVIRACYQGDVGLHVAKTIWAVLKSGRTMDSIPGTLTQKVAWLGEMYIEGSKNEEHEQALAEIKVINKKIFDKSDPQINNIYTTGREWSLEYLGSIYEKLGTKFDEFFFESEVDEIGIKVVQEFLMKGIFTKSDNAVVFKGEDHGLHTRVFITSQGLPTYEAKEIGLNTKKFEMYPNLDESIIVTGNEQNDYFKVLLKVLSLTHPEIAERTRHLSHGLMRFQSGKMSSRKGDIVPAESLIEDIKQLVMQKMADRNLPMEDVNEISNEISIAAIKYTVLRQAIGGDVIFDSSKSISFEGDSGPYLQYSAVRARSVIEKAKAEGAGVSPVQIPKKIGILERLLVRFPDVANRAAKEYAPQQIANYLIALAGAFNSYYSSTHIIDKNEPESPYRIALTKSFLAVITQGLNLLGIKVPKKM